MLAPLNGAIPVVAQHGSVIACGKFIDKLLDDTEAAGWDRSKAASALMYLSAKRLRAGAPS